MTLTELPIGQNAQVTSVDDKNAITKRLMELGVVPGASVEVVKTAPFGDPIEIRIRGYNLAMRRNEADAVTVSCPAH
jgi:ferrous iron transport protein A